MPETLETIAAKLTDLGESIKKQFSQVDQRFSELDKKVDQAKAHLEMKIEAVQADVHLVYDVVIAQQDRNKANDRAHKVFKKRLDNHEIRILALEPPKPSDR